MEDRKMAIKEETEEKEERKTDIAEAENENRELSDDKLDNVTGAAYPSLLRSRGKKEYA